MRDIDTISDEFSFSKKILQKAENWLMRKVSGTSVEDATSGFRAYSKEAALKLNRFSEYTYTLDTIVQAGNKNISISTVPIKTKVNPADLQDYLVRRELMSLKTRWRL